MVVINPRPAARMAHAHPAAAAPAPAPEEVTEFRGDKTRVLRLGEQPPVEQTAAQDWSRRVLTGMQTFFLPANLPHSVSPDYLATRKWWFVRDVLSNAAGFCAGAAMGTALGISPVWGGAAMATFNLIRDRVSQGVGFAASFATPIADKNPRPWIVAGETLEHIGTTLDSTVGLFPQHILPIALTGAVLRTTAGTLKGAAMANIGPRQAIADNLGEVGAKNGNQGFVASLLGTTIGLVAHSVMAATLGPSAPLIIAAIGSAGAVAANSMMVNNLDMFPINEATLRTVVERQGQEIPSPSSNVWADTPSLWTKNHHQVGRSIEPLVADKPRFEQLRSLYAARKYLLELVDGKPYVVMRKGAEAEDRFLAGLQCVTIDKLQRENPQADRDTLISQSLQATPDNPTALLKQLGQAGWSTDMIRVADDGLRAEW